MWTYLQSTCMTYQDGIPDAYVMHHTYDTLEPDIGIANKLIHKTPTYQQQVTQQ